MKKHGAASPALSKPKNAPMKSASSVTNFECGAASSPTAPPATTPNAKASPASKTRTQHPSESFRGFGARNVAAR